MRVIAGEAKGRKLITENGYAIRPTTDKVKEAIFSSIQFSLSGATVLDLFAGSGQMGIESLSRGAKKAVFVDNAATSRAIVLENLINVGMNNRATIFAGDAATFLNSTTQKFDIAILDPPYHMGILEETLPLLIPCMNADGIVLCEHESERELPVSIDELHQKKVHRYGKICVTTYICERGESPT